MRTKLLRRLLHARDGGVMVIVAVAAIAVVGATGVAVDMGRSQMVQAKLQNAVDAAGLAAGATLNTADITAVATKYINLNFSQGTLGATLGTVTATLSEDRKIVTVTTSATLDTTLMKVLGRNTVTVNATTEVTRSNKGLELALVLDTTGSMSGSKLTALKDAGHDLLDILFGANAVGDNLWVGVVPFSQAVNVGSSRTDWLDASHYAGLDWGPTSWSGCVDARYASGRDVTDDPPFDLAAPVATPASPYERLKAYYWPDDGNNNWESTSTSSDTDTTTLCNKKSSCTCANYGPCTTTVAGNVSTKIYCTGSGSKKYCYKDVTTTTTSTTYDITSTKGPNKYCPSAITPLTNVKATVEDGIDALVARGNTHINLGAVWGWRLISPRWRGYWGGDMNTNSLPLNYNSPLMSKAVIIMTDGVNTTGSNNRSAYDYPSVSGINSTQLNDKTTAACNAMKAQGVIVYTILFQETDDTVKTLLRNCATTPDYFFDSPTESSLQSAFQTIGDSLANLRISK